jgi:hypothetical protein
MVGTSGAKDSDAPDLARFDVIQRRRRGIEEEIDSSRQNVGIGQGRATVRNVQQLRSRAFHEGGADNVLPAAGVWAGTERVVAERRRLVMDQPSLRTGFLYFSSGPKPTRPLWWHSIYQPECQLDQSDNDDCAEDNELSENKLWLVDRANFDYYAP